MKQKKKIELSNVEKQVLKQTGREIIYPPTEKIPCIVVDNFPMLGKITALRFIEWIKGNPQGIISLPTGKTPEFFIKWAKYYLDNWENKEVKKELEAYGIQPGKRPNTKSLRFVQMDDFYPMDPNEQNSFYQYINNYYIKGLELDKNKALLMDTSKVGIPDNLEARKIFSDEGVDLSLRNRYPHNHKEEIEKNIIHCVDQFCTNYEERIREMGGIGFFLGGIGPDGHIAFNVRGSDFFSTTRLTSTNYETQAAAATDLGGIEATAKRCVTTIGLSTITFNKDVTAIIFAAGTSKSEIVANGIQNEPSNLYPATILQKLSNSRFYLTRGAASKLIERNYKELASSKKLTKGDIAKVVIDLSLQNNTRIVNLTEKDYKKNRFSKKILEKEQKKYKEISKNVEKKLLSSIEDGLKEPENLVFLHTAPHHDDILLGYLPYFMHLIRTPKNSHHFAYMTSGFVSVTNKYMLKLLRELQPFIETPSFENLLEGSYFDSDNRSGMNKDIHFYLDGIAGGNEKIKNEAECRRFLRNIIRIYEEKSLSQIKNRIHELINYFETQYPGKKDLEHIQKLKGSVREWEAELLWRYTGFTSEQVHHLRLGFYKGEMFTESPAFYRDVEPIVELLDKIKPDVVTVALDPESSGPDTHYKVLQAIAEALKKHNNKKIQIWGYRNVWETFHPCEINSIVPVSLNSISILNSAFMNCFGSQREASFPSYKHEGPFSELSQIIWVEQYRDIKVCLGDNYFSQNPHPRLRATHGMLYLKKISLDEFYKHSVKIKEYTEGSSNKESRYPANNIENE
jgi:glucosamine-6-phosphate deaminase